MLRHLLGNPAATFSVQKFYAALRSQGIAVAKDTVHAYLAHLEDAFLVRTVNLHSASERQRMVNPRKAYPIDPGLIPIHERSGRAQFGHALETTVLLELERRGADVGYVRTPQGFEVDFHARFPDGSVRLFQVCADLSDAGTVEREVRALLDATAVHPEAEPMLLTSDTLPASRPLPKTIHRRSVAEWLLET